MFLPTLNSHGFIVQKASRSIVLLLALCFTFSLVLPTFNPKQEAEADVITDPEFWQAVAASAVANGGVDAAKHLIEEVKMRWSHKDGVDSEGSHGSDGHVSKQVTNNEGSSVKRWKCGECGATGTEKKTLEDAGHCQNKKDCEESPKDDGVLDGCGLTYYDCTASNHAANTCKCGAPYRECRKGEHGDDCSIGEPCTCCASEYGCGCSDCTCPDCPNNNNDDGCCSG